MKKLNSSSDFLSYCGLFCEACRWSTNFKKAGPDNTDPIRANDGTCNGCRSTPDVCGFCEIKKCASKKGYETCADCDQNPCSEIVKLRDDGDPHHADISRNLERIKQSGTETWVSEQRKRWTCSCGERFAWYDRTCQSCGKKVESY